MKSLLFLLPVACFLACSNDSGSGFAGGPGSETTNGIYASVDGIGAPYAAVALRKIDFKATEAKTENAVVVPDLYADSTGFIDLQIPESGDYRLTVTHNGSAFTTVVHSGEFSADTVQLVFTAWVEGLVDVPEKSDGVWVGVLGTDILVRSDSCGRFILPMLPANDSLNLYFVSEDYQEDLGQKSIYAKPKENVTVDFTLPKDSVDTLPKKDTLNYIVAYTAEGPVPYAAVAIHASDYTVDFSKDLVAENSAIKGETFTDNEGKFILPSISNGTKYRLTISSGSHLYSKELLAEEILKLDSVELSPLTVMSGKVTLKTNSEFAWVGIYGLDVLAKTNEAGFFIIPNIPLADTAKIYVAYNGENKVAITENIYTKESGTLFWNPKKMAQNFESDGDNWYVSQDTLNKGTVFSTATIKDGIEFDSGLKSKVFHGEYRLAKDDYAWVLVGEEFENAMNFSELDSISFMAKGDGQIKISLENWIADEGFSIKAASGWFDLNANWKRFVVKPGDLCYNYLDVNNCALAWNAVKNNVKQLHIFAQNGNNFYIDDVVLYGVWF